MSWVYLLQLNVRCSGHYQGRQSITTKIGRNTAHLSKPPRELFLTWAGDTYLCSQPGDSAKGAKEKNLISDVITAGGQVHESELFTSRGGCISSLCLPCNYIVTFLY